MIDKNWSRPLAAALLPMALTACGTTQNPAMVNPGAVRGQEVQPGQSTEVQMSRQQAEAAMNSQNSGLGESSTEVAGRPDVAAQQGALPQGVGYNNVPGVVYDPAIGTLHYGSGVQHHIVHHVHYAGSGGVSSAPPPSGYVRGAIEIPNNENPNSRGGGMNGIRANAYNIPAQHLSGGTARYGGANRYMANDGTGVPSGFYAGSGSWVSGATTWGDHFGRYNSFARNGNGVTEGFTD